MAMAKFRAVENNVPVVISSVSGQTAVIDSDGQLLEMAVPFSQTYVISHLPVAKNGHKSTFYNKSGDIFGYGMLFFFIAVLLIRLFVGIIQYIQKRK
jgi:apolipoprotein N-acyltransferase